DHLRSRVSELTETRAVVYCSLCDGDRNSSPRGRDAALMIVSDSTVALALATILAQSQLPGLPQAAPRSALVVGQVIDASTGAPVSGALVEVRMQASLAP